MTARIARRAGAGLAALLLAVLAVVAGPAPAQAASGDVIRSWTQTYDVAQSGRVHVTETLVYQFASPSSSHGITRGVVVREPYTVDDTKDRTYTVSNIKVSADAPVSTAFSTSTATSTTRGKRDGRNQQLVIRVGSASEYVNTPVVAYTLSYDLDGAIISPQDGDELFWDVVPSDAPTTLQAKVTMTMPGTSVLTHTCNVGTTGSSSGGCATDSVSGQTGTFAASQLGRGRGMTVSMIVPDGTIANNQPVLVDSPVVEQQRRTTLSLIGAGATSLLSVLGGLLWYRRNGRDERYLGVPPGLTPAPGQEGTIGRDTKPEIPVQFAPPPITVGEAGMLVDGRVDVRDTTATLMDLAVRGAVRLNADPQRGELSATLLAPGLATMPHEQELILSLFNGGGPQKTVELGERGTMADAHARVTRELTATIRQRQWFKAMPNGLTGGLAALVPVLIGIVFFFPGLLGALFSAGLVLLLPLLPIVVLLMVISAIRRNGRRSADGRAVADQVEGFRTYLTTAEAEQLKFEEGEDIFSRYLPWAIMFGVAERWTKVCQRLVELGRIPDVQPSWYYGPWGGYGYFPTVWIDDGLSTSAMPEVQVSTDSGFGSGGSSFDGGSVGGGGGGGSVGSW